VYAEELAHSAIVLHNQHSAPSSRNGADITSAGSTRQRRYSLNLSSFTGEPARTLAL
jgi:hypothetical protein